MSKDTNNFIESNTERLELANKELTESLEEIFLFHRQTKQLMGIHDLGEICNVAESLLDSAADFVFFRMVFVDENGNPSRVVREICPEEITIDNELIKWSLANGDPAFIPFEQQGEAQIAPVRSVIVLPLVGPTMRIGVILLWVDFGEDEFSEHLRYILEMIAREVSSAVENLRLAEKLRQTSQFLFDVSDSVSHGIFVLDEKGRISMLNANVEFLFSLVRQDILGKYYQHVFSDQCCDMIRFLIRQFKAGADVGEQEMEHNLEDGTAVTLGVSISPLARIEGRDGYVFICRDLRLTREVVKLRELDAMKNDFVSLVSHELRTPLASIMAYTETLLMEGVVDSEEERKEYLRIIYDEGERLSRLITDVLDLSKMEAGKMVYYFEMADIKQVIERCVTHMDGLMQKNAHTVVVSVEDGLPQIRMDEDRIKQVITNLLSNSIKFTAEGGRIELKGWLERKKEEHEVDNIHIAVIDNGIGIAPSQLSSVFGKFEQVEEMRHHSSGTGLGMPICRQIVEVGHGGKIWIESELGSGTEVHLLLPCSS